MASSQDVYVGFWVNFTGGKIAGATLTLQSRDGAYLVAFLAMFVRIAGNHFWKLLCYLAFHTLPQASRPSDVPWRQQRAVLRNSYSAMDAVVKFCRIAVASKRTARPTLIAPLLLAVTAILNVVGFILAGIFSSAVTRAQSSVLLRPAVCGNWLDAPPPVAKEWNQPTIIRSIDLVSVIHQNLVTSSRFHLTCSGSLNQSGNCNPYGGRFIEFTTTNSTCPFDASICQSPKAIRLDTGHINSHTDLGINAPPSDRIDIRKILQCAPLRTSGYGDPAMDPDASKVDERLAKHSLTGFFYGQNRRVQSNYTYAYNPDAFQTSIGSAIDISSYQLE